MSFLASAAAVCLIVCHGGPADHFATFTENLSKEGTKVEVYASGPALKKFQERGIDVKLPFSLEKISNEDEDLLAEQIAKACSKASIVITDVGHYFDIKIQKALAREAANTPRFAYYDNPESYVPGGYSSVAAQVMKAAHGVLFANSHLAKEPLFQEVGNPINLEDQKKIGIGYYPLHQAEKIAKQRAQRQVSLRQSVFTQNNLVDKGQKVLVYFGGNNEEYFSKAFPAFLNLIEKGMEQSDFSNLVVVMQQHPGAKSKNIDGNMILSWINQNKNKTYAPQVILSDFSSDEAQIIADAALYYQTSMGPQFVLAGIKTIQIGHETFEDILVRNHLSPSITNPTQLIGAINQINEPKKEVDLNVIFKDLGIAPNWLYHLKNAINENQKTDSK